jgi:hypothetical protein
VTTSIVTVPGSKITQHGDSRIPFRPAAKDRKDI